MGLWQRRDQAGGTHSPRRSNPPDVTLPLLLLRVVSWTRVCGSSAGAGMYYACQFHAMRAILQQQPELASDFLSVRNQCHSDNQLCSM